MSEIFEVSKVWVITQDEDGNTIPVFIQVRSDDIHSSDSTIFNSAITEALSHYPHNTLVKVAANIEVNGMTASAYNDGSYDARCRIPVSSPNTVLKDNIFASTSPLTQQGFLFFSPLPFTTRFDRSLDVQADMSGFATAFGTARINAIPMRFVESTLYPGKYKLYKADMGGTANAIMGYVTSTETIDPNKLGDMDYAHSCLSVRIHGSLDTSVPAERVIPPSIHLEDIWNVDSDDVLLGHYEFNEQFEVSGFEDPESGNTFIISTFENTETGEDEAIDALYVQKDNEEE